MAKAGKKSASVGGSKKSSSKRKNVVLSKVSSARRVSRLGKMRAAGESGKRSLYVSRSTAMKRLQVTLRDFRRLCILKGVYPREVSKLGRSFDSRQTYYSVKDIASLAHEPLLAKFREFKTLMRKVRKCAGRGEVEAARRKHGRYESYSLHRIIKERYPRFGDALHDADDALSTVCLFASLPAEGRVDAAVVARCAALEHKWNRWVLQTGALTKAFISVKGIYLEARVGSSERVAWLVPHRFAAPPPHKRDVDYRVMLTFLELYEILLKFILHKLYKDDAHELAADDYPRRGVFRGLVIAFSREAAYPWLVFIAKCGGADVVDADSSTPPTHVVLDRPGPPTVAARDAELVQPQWIVDSFNTNLKLPIANYAPGVSLPPHLSPFASDDYVPAYRDQLDNLKSAYAAVRDATETDDDKPADPKPADPKPADPASPTPPNLATILMSKKAKRLHGRMLNGIARKRQAIDKLRARRANLEQAAASRAAGSTHS